jgi:site-specific DNA-methyltransferase (adenine-specific)
MSNFNEVVDKGWDVAPSKELFSEILRISKNQIIWGGNYFELPATRGFLIWDKNISEDFSLAMAEYGWTSFDKLSKIYKRNSDKLNRVHPTQKPISIMEWCLDYAKVEKHHKVFDPFMGSGTTAVACQSLGLEWCGCELEPDYVAIANKRLEAVQGSLF